MASSCSRPVKCLMCGGDDHQHRRCAQYREWRQNSRQQVEEQLLELVPSISEVLDGAQDVPADLTMRQQKIVSEARTDPTMTFADIVAGRVKSRRRKRQKKKKSQRASGPPVAHSEVTPIPDSQVQEPTPEQAEVSEEPHNHPEPITLTGPLDRVIGQLNFDGVPPDQIDELTEKLRDAAVQALEQWIIQAVSDSQGIINKIAADAQQTSQPQPKKSKKPKVTCECGMKYFPHHAQVHARLCRLNKSDQSRRRQRQYLPPSQDEVKVADGSSVTGTPSKKSTRKKQTPESIRQMKMTHYAHPASDASASNQETPFEPPSGVPTDTSKSTSSPTSSSDSGGSNSGGGSQRS